MTGAEVQMLRQAARDAEAAYHAALGDFVAARREVGDSYYAIGDEVGLSASYLRLRKFKSRPPAPRRALPERHYHSDFLEA